MTSCGMLNEAAVGDLSLHIFSRVTTNFHGDPSYIFFVLIDLNAFWYVLSD
jgi:hypothetical protein